MHKIKIGKNKDMLPEAWSDVSERMLNKIILNLISDNEDKYMRSLRVLVRLTGIRRSVLESLTTVQVYSLLECINWMFESYPELPIIKKLKASRTLIPPAEKLENSSFIEFAYADSYFDVYIRTREEKYLNKLIACLYRPRRNIFYRLLNPFATDLRCKFNTVLVDAMAERINHMPLRKKLSVLLFYIGCRKFIVKQYGVIFDHDDYSNDPSLPEELRARLKEEAETRKANASTQENFGWLSLVNAISKTGQYGDYEKTMYTNVHTVLYNRSMDLIQQRNSNVPKQQ